LLTSTAKLYTMGQTLGEGTFGRVHEARRGGTAVVIKVFDPAKGAAQNAKEDAKNAANFALEDGPGRQGVELSFFEFVVFLFGVSFGGVFRASFPRILGYSARSPGFADFGARGERGGPGEASLIPQGGLCRRPVSGTTGYHSNVGLLH
jgi:hypothetical protein